MSTLTLEAPVIDAPVITQAAPLTAAQQDELIMLAASSEKIAKVKSGRGLREARAWSLGGNVD